ncbi:triacylglycerol lipase, putative [Ricinus communis]|uniref:Triacylglycerol lipase, putative n=1 Tax=Ricinus communis TaxID=3988 RepID=B9T280_RICCO|nr:triacylglycerol lipase, putative [Ricinus communis]|eukprot:XP_002532349.1 phospholipase A1-Ibeta2, chloroplastic [Ricinus communis]
MQIGATLPAQNLHLLQARIGSFRCQRSPLNPLTKSTASCSFVATHHQSLKSVTSTESTKKHLSNLEKLLQKQPPEITRQPDPPQQVDKLANNNNGSLANRGKNLLEGLNLARIWPEMKAAEEMSPRHLNRLQRLLSMTEQYSPRNHLGSRWREYHGSNNWEGLLDPLDENLRREVVRYGEYVQAAYHSFHSNPAMSTQEPPLPRHVALPDRSYKVTKSLYATTSVGLPKWVDDVASDLGWMTQRSSWVGYVAVCDDKREIQRMGRRDIVIALRGTATCLEWAENMRAHLVGMPGDHEQTQGQPKVECGFLSLYKTRGAHVASLAESAVEEIKRLMEVYKGEALSITITGHSLGAALALLVGDDLSTIASEMPPIAVFSFGGPKVGNRGFANQINAKNVKVLRIVNSQDVITRVPCLPVVEDLHEDMPLAYSHVGVELRIDSKMSPYLKPNADVACCHDLEAYLHLVDGFMASNCPFRANAKRSLVKLVNDQRSNVKKLYTSKAHALSLNLERQGFSTSGCLPSPSQ